MRTFGMLWRRTGLLLLACAMVLVGSACSDGDEGSAPASSSSTSTSASPAQLSGDDAAGGTTALPAEAPPGSEADLVRAGEAVAGVRDAIPYPDDVVACIVARIAPNADLISELEAGEAGAGDLVAQGAACAVAVAGAPEFVDGLAMLTGGTLSEAQSACAADAYGQLSPEDLQALSGSVLNPEEASSEAVAVWDGLIEQCGIVLKGGD